MSEQNPAELAAKFVNYTSKHIFLTGKAGTGKTTFLRNLIELTHKKAVSSYRHCSYKCCGSNHPLPVSTSFRNLSA
jgi:Cdc6-like AAA superfamily ATPase